MRWKTGNLDVEGPGYRKHKRGELESGKGARVIREHTAEIGKMKWDKGKVEEWEDGGWKKVDVEERI